MAIGSAHFLTQACIALRKLSEEVDQTRCLAMSLLGPCGQFDRKELEDMEVTELVDQVKELQRGLFRVIGGGTTAAAEVLKAKNFIRSFD